MLSTVEGQEEEGSPSPAVVRKDEESLEKEEEADAEVDDESDSAPLASVASSSSVPTLPPASLASSAQSSSCAPSSAAQSSPPRIPKGCKGKSKAVDSPRSDLRKKLSSAALEHQKPSGSS